MKGITLRHLSFHGPSKPNASVSFEKGLNVVFGASDTGKSFIVDAIDFMLGGGKPLRDFPEREGYDIVLLGLESAEGVSYTIQRSVQGGGFLLYEGSLSVPPVPGSVSAQVMQDHHNEKRLDNISVFLLGLCGLDGKRIRQNRYNRTNSLSFRNVARLAIIDDTEIIRRESPLFDGNPTANTVNKSTFKLLLTGVDDSSLVETVPTTAETITKDAQLDLLDDIIDNLSKRLRALTKDTSDIDGQLERLDRTLVERSERLSAQESEYRRLSRRRLELRKSFAATTDRRDEITSLLERFQLLDRHYLSDIARLTGLREAGTLFEAMGKEPCPFCGSDPEHHQEHPKTSVDVAAVIEAAARELTKIAALRRDLADTVVSLRSEGVAVGSRLARLEPELDSVTASMEREHGPQLSEARTSYKEVADKRARVSEAQFVRNSLTDAQQRRTAVENSVVSQIDTTETALISADALQKFAERVETLLLEWHFPDTGSVYFDRATNDLVIAGKPRGSRGAGLRSITHAAFTLGLLDHCRRSETPHPGFVVLDSPLLSYREPEGKEDDLRGTDLKERFYELLFGWTDDRQVIIVETTDPPPSMTNASGVLFFSKNYAGKRYGLFPVSLPKNDSAGIDTE